LSPLQATAAAVAVAAIAAPWSASDVCHDVTAGCATERQQCLTPPPQNTRLAPGPYAAGSHTPPCLAPKPRLLPLTTGAPPSLFHAAGLTGGQHQHSPQSHTPLTTQPHSPPPHTLTVTHSSYLASSSPFCMADMRLSQPLAPHHTHKDTTIQPPTRPGGDRPPTVTHSSNLPSSSPLCMADMRPLMALGSLLRVFASVWRNLQQNRGCCDQV
jgi:hypothetical protein